MIESGRCFKNKLWKLSGAELESLWTISEKLSYCNVIGLFIGFFNFMQIIGILFSKYIFFWESERCFGLKNIGDTLSICYLRNPRMSGNRWLLVYKEKIVHIFNMFGTEINPSTIKNWKKLTLCQFAISDVRDLSVFNDFKKQRRGQTSKSYI